MEKAILKATYRGETGTKASRKMRRRGEIPAILYGKGLESVFISVDEKEVSSALRHGFRMVTLKLPDGEESALIREVQYGVLKEDLLHLDFQRVARDERIEVKVEIQMKGEASGVAMGGVLEQVMHEIAVRCQPAAIPERIIADVSRLKIGDILRVRDLVLPEGVEVIAEPDTAVALVTERVEEVVPTPVTEAAREPEVIGAPKATDEEESGKT